MITVSFCVALRKQKREPNLRAGAFRHGSPLRNYVFWSAANHRPTRLTGSDTSGDGHAEGMAEMTAGIKAELKAEITAEIQDADCTGNPRREAMSYMRACGPAAIIAT